MNKKPGFAARGAKKRNLQKQDLMESVTVGGVFSIVLLFVWAVGTRSDFFYYGEEGVTVGRTVELFQETYTKESFFLAFLGIWAAGSLIWGLLLNMNETWKKVIFRFRYGIVLILLAVCIVLELSGSSMSSWCNALGVSPQENGVLFRTANPYRSDEFAVNTLFAVAQAKNPGGAYPYFSEIVRGTATDMYIVYGQPVRSFGIIFRPFQIGYLLFGTAKGLAFFWCGRLLFLFMASFEFGRIFLEKKKLAVIYALMLTLSPVIQWWFAINGLVEMFIFGQLCAMMLWKYMNEKKLWKKIAESFVFFWSGAVYILVFYPAWQVALGYVFLGIFIWVILENRTKRPWKLKEDLPVILGTGAVILFLMLILLFRSWDTIQTTLNTVYPGQRVSTDKLQLQDLFGGLYNIYLALSDSHLLHEWGFVDFFPLGILMAVYVLIKNKKKDSLLIILLILQGLLLIIYTLPVPEILTKVTLLSMSTPNRALIAIQFLNILLLLRSCIWLHIQGKAYKVIVGGLVCAVGVTWIFAANIDDIPLSFFMMVGMALLFFTVSVLVWRAHRSERILRWMCLLVLTIGLIGGGLVNPVQKGLDFIEKSVLLDEIESVVAEDPDGKWIVEGMQYPNTNLTLLAGASTINSTNVYPAMERWNQLDPSGKYEDVYNRYAHILINLQEGETEFSLLYPDSFQVSVNTEDMKTLNVSYILSQNELEQYSDICAEIEKVKTIEAGQMFIYKVSYR